IYRCPTPGCNGRGHVNSNRNSHRRCTHFTLENDSKICIRCQFVRLSYCGHEQDDSTGSPQDKHHVHQPPSGSGRIWGPTCSCADT
ncbi:hypothetical protein CAPTEDRAFT_89486, partial [Capitella teleta]